MRQRIETAVTGAIAAIASLLAVLASPALAGDVPVGPDPIAGAHAAPCGPPGASCARISGYIRAGAEFPDSNARRSARFAQPPRLSGFGVAGAAAPSEGLGFLRVSGDDGAR